MDTSNGMTCPSPHGFIFLIHLWHYICSEKQLRLRLKDEKLLVQKLRRNLLIAATAA